MPLIDLDEARGTFAHHAHCCRVTRRGLRLSADILVGRHEESGHQPGLTALSFACPSCVGCGESFNTNLGPEDEDAQTPGNHPGRAEQARLIRRMMRHPHVNLPTRETPRRGGGEAV